MIIVPKIRNNICLNAHPLGCAAQVKAQINYIKTQDRIEGPKRVLVLGASNGYGLAARIVSCSAYWRAFSAAASALLAALSACHDIFSDMFSAKS